MMEQFIHYYLVAASIVMGVYLVWGALTTIGICLGKYDS